MQLKNLHILLLGIFSILLIIASAVKSQVNLAISRLDSEMALEQVKGTSNEFLAKSHGLHSANNVLSAVLIILIALALFSLYKTVVANFLTKPKENKDEPASAPSPNEPTK